MTARPRRRRNFFTHGATKIPWCRLADGRTYVDPRKFGLKPFTRLDHEQARAEALAIARERETTGSTWQAITPERRAVLITAEALLPPGISLVDAVKAGVAVLQRRLHPVGDVVRELLDSKSGHDYDGRTARDMSQILGQFAAAFPGDLGAITPQDIESFLAARLGPGAQPLSPKRRNHIHACIVRLFRFARGRKYLPDDITAAQLVERQKVRRGAIDFFTPAEMQVILQHIDGEWLPWPVLVGFNGVRVEEVALGNHAAARKDCLRWEDFDWHDREIVIREAVAKTGRPRRIPIQDVTFAWLAPFQKATGPVVPNGHIRGRLENFRERFRTALAKLAEETDAITPRLLKWPTNAFRHSYGSYRMAVTKNAQQVSNEMGDTPAMIHRHYDNPRPLSQAKAWWSIFPENTERLAQLILRFDQTATA